MKIDGELGVAIALPGAALDPAQEALHEWRLTSGKGEVDIDVERAEAGQVRFDGLRLETVHPE